MAALSTKAVGWNVAASVSGALAAISFAQSHSVDIYAFFDQLKKTYGDLVTLGMMAAPFISYAGAACRTWKMKQAPAGALVVNVGSYSKAQTDAMHPPGNSAEVRTINGTATGTVVGAMLLALIVFVPGGADAQSLNPLQRAPNIIQSIRDTVIADLTAARDDAHSFSDPSEACWQVLLTHAQTMPPKLMGVAHTAQRLRDLRRGLPDVSDKCAVVKDGAKQALLQIFGTAIGGASALAAFGF